MSKLSNLLKSGLTVAATLSLVACGGGNVKKDLPAVPVTSSVAGSWANCKYFDSAVRADVVQSVKLDDLLLVGGGGKTLQVPSGQVGVLVYLGMKPSLGYGFKLGQGGAQAKGSELILNIDQSAPPQGAMVAQMLTYPCGLVTVPDQGYRKVTIQGPFRGLPASVPVK